MIRYTIRSKSSGPRTSFKLASLRSLVAAMMVLWIACLCDSARANLVIIPTFESSITSNSNAPAIEASINSVISRVDAEISNNVTVTIDFQSMTSGLGESATSEYVDDYASYRTDLSTQQTLSTNDKIALSSLPVQTANPVGGAFSDDDVFSGSSTFRALGENAPGFYGPGVLGNGGSQTGTFDGVIGLNTSICNLSRTGTQNPNYYDLQAVAAHEVDEVLGIGGTGSSLYLQGAYSGETPDSGYVGALDLFRYASAGVRSYTLDPTANAYFSIDGGNTRFVYFNQNNSGSDFSDWGNGTPNAGHGNTPPQVQDAFGTPGVDTNIGPNELAALDVVGWNLTPAGLALEAQVPEPSMAAMSLVGLMVILSRPCSCHRRISR